MGPPKEWEEETGSHGQTANLHKLLFSLPSANAPPPPPTAPFPFAIIGVVHACHVAGPPCAPGASVCPTDPYCDLSTLIPRALAFDRTKNIPRRNSGESSVYVFFSRAPVDSI